MNLFFFKRMKKNPAGEEVIFEDSFNTDLVIRTMGVPEGMIVLLNDGHERPENVPEYATDSKGEVIFVGPEGKKRPKVKSWRRERQWMQSEILVTQEDDIQRLREIFETKGIISYNPSTLAVE